MSDSLIDQYKQIHSARQYGDTSIKNLRYLRPQVQMLAPKTILDFGCGRSLLVDALGEAANAVITRHDPAIPEYSAQPDGVFDLLTNIDVLEHVPESELDELVGKMASLCRHAIIIIDTRPAIAVLPNGENAHCTLRPHEWWQVFLSKHFEHVEPIRVTRRSRAAFRTWKLDVEQQSKLRKLLFREKISYYWHRLLGRK